MQTQEIKLHGVNLLVEFTVEGKHYPSTYFQPEEYPEIIIKRVMAADSEINILDLIEHYYEEIHDKLWNDYSEQ